MRLGILGLCCLGVAGSAHAGVYGRCDGDVLLAVANPDAVADREIPFAGLVALFVDVPKQVCEQVAGRARAKMREMGATGTAGCEYLRTEVPTPWLHYDAQFGDVRLVSAAASAQWVARLSITNAVQLASEERGVAAIKLARVFGVSMEAKVNARIIGYAIDSFAE